MRRRFIRPGHVRMALTPRPLENLSQPLLDGTATAVFREQVRLLYRLSFPAYFGSLLVALTVALGLWSTAVSATILAGWFALVAAITSARVALYRSYNVLEQASDGRIWASRFVLGAMAMGAAWGILGAFVMPPADWHHQLLTVFVIAGMVASALVVLTPVKAAFIGFAVCALLPIIVAM